MKRIFIKYLKELYNKKKPHLSKLTTEFNLWVGGYSDKKNKIRRFNFHAHVNRFMVRKWLEKLNIEYIDD